MIIHYSSGDTQEMIMEEETRLIIILHLQKGFNNANPLLNESGGNSKFIINWAQVCYITWEWVPHD